MKKEDHDKIISSIQEKAGDEVSGVIADDLGLLITDNSNMLDIIEKQSKQIEKLEKQNNNLVAVNGNLLQQVGMSEYDEDKSFKNKDPEEPKKPFNYKSVFDENGNFI